MGLPPVDFPTLGWQVADWIEAYLCHGPGDVQGEPWVLDDEQVLFLCHAYRLHEQGHPQAGRRLIHHAVYSRPKGRAKSELGGGITCAEGFGPVRFDGWDANGDPVGVPVQYPFIRCLATEEEQSGNTYDNVTYMLQEGRAIDEYAIDVGMTRTLIKEKGGGEIVPSTSGSASKDGGKETFAVADETHLYNTDQLRGMYRTVARNTGKRKAAEPWMMDTTTAWMPGERSIAEQTNEKYGAMPVAEAVLKKGVLFDHRQAEAPKMFGSDASLKKALKTGYGDAADWMDLDRIVKIIREAEDPEAEAYRYWLNIPRAGVARWLTPEEIAAVTGPVDIPEKSMIALGFDGSENDDHTALIACTEDGDIKPIGLWVPDPEDVSWRQEVNNAIAWAFENFQVVRFYGDPPFWQDDFANWLKDYGSPPVVEFWTNVYTKMAVACGALRTEIRRESVTIDPVPLLTDEIKKNGRSLLTWHFENAHVTKVRVKLEDKTEEAYVIRKERAGSELKIDGGPAAVLARRARDDAIKLDLFKKKRPARLVTF